MRRSPLRLYAPFLALVLAQALLIAVAPSNGPERTGEVAAFDPDSAPTGPSDVASDGTTGRAANAASRDTSSGSGAAATGGGGADDGALEASDPAGAQPNETGGEAAAAGDTSHCTADGRQHGILFHSPPCAPKWPDGADNGGATSPGVTEDEILVVSFATEPNEQVNAILSQEGLAQSERDVAEFADAALTFLHEHYEFYGRKIKYVRVVGDCPTSPPEPDKCKVAASEVAKMQPFIVFWATPLYAEVFDVFARAGIISLGGWHFDNDYFTQRRPYRYDLNMDGDRSADVLAEYYCKKLAGNPADRSGRLIHQEIGARGAVDRHLGIVVPEIEANVLTAQRVRDQLAACGDAGVPIFTYESDINRAADQTRATVAGLIDEGVTTVLCMCDPIAPVFLTKGMTSNNYFPEHLLSGMGFMDFDKVGRLYDSAQWEHAFGPSHIGHPIPHRETDATTVWRETGSHEKYGSDTPCQSCNLNWGYFSIIGTMIQTAGPELNPINVERAMLGLPGRGGWEQTGGRADLVLTEFGPGDYTALSDFREVFWSNSAASPIDGRNGHYVTVNDGRRYRLGELDSSTEQIPVKPQ